MSADPWRWLWRGAMAAADLRIEFDARPPELPAACRELMAEHWAKLLAENEAEGRLLFDGSLAQLREHGDSPAGLCLRLGRTSYRHWRASRDLGPLVEARFGAGARSRPLALCAALITRDRCLLITRRSATVAEGAGLFHVPGGHLDPDRHRRGDRPDPRLAMLRELEEELGLQAAELSAGRLLGLVESLPEGKPELLYRFRCALDNAALVARAASGRDRHEFSRLLFVPLEELGDWRDRHRARLATPSRALLSLLVGDESVPPPASVEPR